MTRRSTPILAWWGSVLVGVLSVGVGGTLVGRPFTSLSVLVWLVGAALLITGIGEIVAPDPSSLRWLSMLGGAALIIGALVVVAWSDITVLALAFAAGIALVVRGLLRVVDGFLVRGIDRWIDWITGSAGTALGVVAVSWPTVTLLVVAVVFGISTVIFGIRQIIFGLRSRRPLFAGAPARSRGRTAVRLFGAIALFAVAVIAVGVSIAVHRAHPGDPGPFYTAPSPLPEGPPGTVIRTQIVAGFQPNATTYRVLYLSTGFDGAPTAVSGLVIIPDVPAPATGRKIVGYTHGTVGVASNCAPSLQGDAWAEFMRSEGLTAFVDAGYVVAATDYQGLGTPGPHPYLVGHAEGMDELDMVRAARSMPQAKASADVAFWGHSQGGHASLFSGQLASTYAPELHVVGVAAGAPAPDLVEMFKANLDSPVGKILIAMALQSWTEVYDAASLDQIVTVAARPIVGQLARTCLYSSLEIIGALPASLALGITFLSNPPWETEPWKTIVESNDPGQAPVGVPVLLTQGAIDVLIPPAVTTALLRRLCANGDTAQLVQLDGTGHLDGGPAAVPTVAKWIAQRFAGEPVTVSDCP